VYRTDNTLEYVKNNVSVFCSKYEIIHQTFYSRTSQQNRVTEHDIGIFWMLLGPWWYICVF